MFKDSRVIPIFPTTIWAHSLAPEVYEPMNQRLKSKIEALLAEGSPGSRQTHTDLQTLEEFSELIGYINHAARHVFEFLKLRYDGFEVTGCWANLRPAGAPQHERHIHPNNYLSGTYYVQTQENADSILFHDPRDQVNIISPKRSELTEYNTREVDLTVRTGSMVLFPAWIYHSVPENKSAGDRISISFNLMFSAFTETMSRPKWRPS